MKLSPGSNAVVSRRMVLLAPTASEAYGFGQVELSRSTHSMLMTRAQQLRGRVYLEEGLIKPSQLAYNEPYVQSTDERAWHLLSIDDDGEVFACARYVRYDYSVCFSDLAVSHSALAQSEIWGSRLRSAVESELAIARQRQISYVELGGWAIANSVRRTTEAIRIMVACYCLGSWLGGAIGASMAKLSSSAPLLRKIGGTPLVANGVELPPYYDPEWHCDLEVLRFDSTRPSAKFKACIDEFMAVLVTIPVVAPVSARSFRPIQPIADANLAHRLAS